MGRPKKQQPYIVVAPFQDAREYATEGTPNQYKEGDDVSHFDEQRLANLVSLGLVTGGNAVESNESDKEAE